MLQSQGEEIQIIKRKSQINSLLFLFQGNGGCFNTGTVAVPPIEVRVILSPLQHVPFVQLHAEIAEVVTHPNVIELFPPKEFHVLFRMFAEVDHVLGQLLNATVVENVEVGAGWQEMTVLCSIVEHRDDVIVHVGECLLRDII